jgi:tetratricopeptide (TPR) repeat protein
VQVISTYGSYFEYLGQFDRAIAERQLSSNSILVAVRDAMPATRITTRTGTTEALVHYRRAVELGSELPLEPSLEFGQAYVQKGCYAERLTRSIRRFVFPAGIRAPRRRFGHAYGVAGRRRRGAEVLDELKKRSAERYVSPYFLALIYVGLGDHDRALASLEAAFQERHPYLVFMKVEPVFDSLRSDVRFAALQKRVGLTEPAIQR